MKNISKYIIIAIFGSFLITFSGCEKFLEEEVYTEYDPEKLLQTEEGINSVLNGAYAELHLTFVAHRDLQFTLSEFPTDITWETGGGYARTAILYINFQWEPTQGLLRSAWSRMYRAIRNANSLFDNIDKVSSLSEETVAQLTAEARFIRAAAYVDLYSFFGPVPILTSAEEVQEFYTRPTNAEMIEFITTELRAAAGALPEAQDLRGKADKGAALAVLAKFYLNTKQWQKCADATQEIRDLNKYSLFAEIEKLFSVDNENNSEYIYVHPALASSNSSNIYMAHAFPPKYPIQSNWVNYGAQFRTYTAFYESFHTNDRRARMFLTSYVDQTGTTIDLVYKDGDPADPADNIRSFKYTPDPNADGSAHGNDIPIIRYADILLSRAEALNELNGPTQEAIDLINEVRSRAEVPLLLLANFPSTASLRDHILQERAQEFFSEGKRRDDLIRHGKFISGAIARGKNAQAHHVLYPIPQSEIEANKDNLVQNTGY